MGKHWKYLRYVLRHKLYVYREGRRLGLGRLQLLVHDWQKLMPVEWFPYVETFYGDKSGGGPRRKDGGYDPNAQGEAFDRAWNHHQKRGPHHWQYWVMPLEDGGIKVLAMPEKYRLEMLADWAGAGRAIKGHGPERVLDETRAWYQANRSNMELHPDTRAWVERKLAIAL